MRNSVVANVKRTLFMTMLLTLLNTFNFNTHFDMVDKFFIHEFFFFFKFYCHLCGAILIYLEILSNMSNTANLIIFILIQYVKKTLLN